jgi:DNA-binding response OmpR family regulator
MPALLALILEDDPKLSKIFSAALKMSGFEIALDQDGTTYKNILASRTPDLILLDIHLPFVSGVDVLSLLRADERWQNIPVIVMTADIAIAKQLENKADLVLVKPFSVSRLQEIAAKMVSSN